MKDYNLLILSVFSLLLWGTLWGTAQIASQEASPSQLLEATDEILREVSQLRQLELLEPVDKGVKSKEEIRMFLIQRLEQEYKREELELEERVLQLLGLLPPEVDLYQTFLDFLSDQVAGFYDPRTKSFYIADWIPLELQKPVLAHELTHVLQDQHFEIEQFIRRLPGNDDRMLARAAFIEGEGVAVMLDYFLKPTGRTFASLPETGPMLEMWNQAAGGMADVPSYIKDSIFFPYIYGTAFLHQARQELAWAEINSIYQNMPSSTEQIMHPEKYFSEDRDEPAEVDLTDLRNELEEGSLVKYSNVLGEFIVYLMLKEFLGKDQARKGAAGWDGDRVELIQQSDGTEVLIHSSVWDSEEEASEFFEAYTQLVSAKFPNAQQTRNTIDQQAWKSQHSEITLKQDGSRVSIFEFIGIRALGSQ